MKGALTFVRHRTTHELTQATETYEAAVEIRDAITQLTRQVQALTAAVFALRTLETKRD